jgi:hypothetical protein
MSFPLELMKTTFLNVIGIVLFSISPVQAEGTIQLRNTIASRVQIRTGAGTSIDVPTSSRFNYGVVVRSTNGPDRLILPLGMSSTTSAGLIDAPTPYFIPGTSEGETVRLEVIGWPAIFGTNWCEAARLDFFEFGTTGVREVTLGGATTPTTIWQGATGVNPNRFNPLHIGLLGPAPILFLVSDVTTTEGTNGSVSADFIISRRYGYPGFHAFDCCTNYPAQDVFATQEGTALAGQDYVARNGTVSFAGGEVATTISVTLTADPHPEPDETFSLILGSQFQHTGTCLITESRIIEVRLDGADSLVTLHSVSGRRYAVEYSTDLTTWNPVDGAGNVTGIGGPVTIRDLGAALGEQRLYRIRLL